MIRRMFLAVCVLALASTEASASDKGIAQRKFAFKIKTKARNIVGNVVTEAKDVEAAKVKLFKRYPGCQILSVQEK